MNQIFNNVGASRVSRSVHNLSYDKKFDADIGVLYPVMCDEVLPGTRLSIGYEAIARAMPLVAPILHQIDIKVHCFFVAYRNIWEDWEEFISGGVDGTDTTTFPTWSPSAAAKRNKRTLWDFLYGVVGVTPDTDSLPSDLPRRAYFDIWNEYYRDQTVMDDIDYTDPPGTDVEDENLQRVSWEKDYFTSAAIAQQRGTPPALPLSGTVIPVDDGGGISLLNTTDATPRTVQTSTAGQVALTSAPSANAPALWADPGLTVDLAGASTSTVADLRLAVQIQRWQERNMRSGVRYVEFLRAHWGHTGFNDGRAQRPVYIGGGQQPVVVTPMYQTESSDASTPQGTLSGNGVSMDRRMLGKYRVPEYGIVMTLMSIRPKPAYDQGINRQWLRRTRYDFFTPEFAHLSEQGILQRELYVDSVKANNETVFGFAEAWSEYKCKQGMLAGEMHTETAGPGGGVPGTLDHWHLGRLFSSAPTLSVDFLECQPRTDAWAAPTGTEFVMNFTNVVRAVLPMPAYNEPGLMDH